MAREILFTDFDGTNEKRLIQRIGHTITVHRRYSLGRNVSSGRDDSVKMIKVLTIS